MSGKEELIEVDILPKMIKEGAIYSINQINPNSYTHGMFKYPCKFIPEIPRWAIKTYLNGTGTVLDPFAGSGTTVLESVIWGYDSLCTEIDDIAKLIIKVKTTKLSKSEYDKLDDVYEALKSGLCEKRISFERPAINNLEHWFSETTIEKLSILRENINKIKNKNIKNFFFVCFVSIIKKVSYADDTSPKPYVSNKIKKNPPSVEHEFNNIYERFKKMEADLLSVNRLGKARILEGDALRFDIDDKVDLAITSPPYINAFDYGRTMRLENIWMQTLSEEELRKKKKDYIGTEKIRISEEKNNCAVLDRSKKLRECYSQISLVDEKRALIVKRFFEDMEKNLILVNKYLKDNGKYMIVIGNSTIRKTNVESWKILEELSSNIGFDTETHFSYEIKNPYIRIPRQGQGGKINRDYVLVLRKKV